MSDERLSSFRICGTVLLLTVLLLTLAIVLPNGARAAEDSANPPPVDTTTNPEALILNAHNPLAIHAGPGKPNVGSIYIAPSQSGKAKKGKEGQTEKSTMGAEPEK